MAAAAGAAGHPAASASAASGETLTLTEVSCGRASRRVLDHARGRVGRTIKVTLPLVGDFMAGNALVAAGLAIATGEKSGACDPGHRWRIWSASPGRLERIGSKSMARWPWSTSRTSPMRWRSGA